MQLNCVLYGTLGYGFDVIPIQDGMATSQSADQQNHKDCEHRKGMDRIAT